MKKLLTIALSLVMVLSMTAVSFAGVVKDEAGNVTGYVDDNTITVTKNYKLDGAGKSPAETFTFSAVELNSIVDGGVGSENQGLPTIGSVTYTAGAAGNANLTEEQIAALGDEYNAKDYMTQNITITLPEYTAVGVYTYSFTEVAGDTAGVTYYGDEIKLVVTVIQDEDNKIQIAAIHTEGVDSDGNVIANGADKIDTFDNVYTANSLTVEKQVTGLMGDREKVFSFTVTFTSPVDGSVVKEDITVGGEAVVEAGENGWTGEKEYTFTLKHDEEIKFDNIPKDVKYEVVEASYTNEGYLKAQYDGKEEGIMANTAIETVVTNQKEGDIDTGIILDNGLYIVLLAGVAVAAGMFFMKRRQDEYDM